MRVEDPYFVYAHHTPLQILEVLLLFSHKQHKHKYVYYVTQHWHFKGR